MGIVGSVYEEAGIDVCDGVVMSRAAGCRKTHRPALPNTHSHKHQTTDRLHFFDIDGARSPIAAAGKGFAPDGDDL